MRISVNLLLASGVVLGLLATGAQDAAAAVDEAPGPEAASIDASEGSHGGSIRRLGSVTVFIRDFDEAIDWYVNKLGLELRADQAYGENRRWVTVAAAGQPDLQIVLNRPTEAENAELRELIGKQALWVFYTDDCRRTYEELSGRGVVFTKPPDVRPWGVQAEFEDLYGNAFVLVETPRQPAAGSPQ